MPVIRIDFDDKKVKKLEVTALCKAVQQIVCNVTKIEDVVVYANSSQIAIKIWPIEIFVQMSAHKIKHVNILVNAIKSKLAVWKKQESFRHLIILTFTPMDWKIELGI